jgi:hypothetical protein
MSEDEMSEIEDALRAVLRKNGIGAVILLFSLPEDNSVVRNDDIANSVLITEGLCWKHPQHTARSLAQAIDRLHVIQLVVMDTPDAEATPKSSLIIDPNPPVRLVCNPEQ